MILPKVLALGVQLVMPVAAADSVPHLNVEQVCKGIADQGGVTFRDPSVPQEKKNCLDSEQVIRDQLVKQWSSFSADDRTHCVNESVMGGDSSYTELLTCLEMARDVRAMRKEQSRPATDNVQKQR
ncbi:MAG: hypothetical protein ACLP19_13180 [Xanthobacteraceae bacterium]